MDAEYHYVRCVEEVELEGLKSFRVVICMTPIMSHYLMNATRVTIDTSFKRVHPMQEFEIEVWLDDDKRCEHVNEVMGSKSDHLLS